MNINDKYIYGPSIGFRVKLQHSVQDKIIHIYGECHTLDSICTSPNGISISQYINDQINLTVKNKQNIDIFVELSNKELTVNNKIDILSRISSVLTSNMKVLKSDNVRIHAGDIRDIISIRGAGFYNNGYSKKINKYLANINSIKMNVINNINNDMIVLRDKLIEMKYILENNDNIDMEKFCRLESGEKSVWKVLCCKIVNSSMKDIAIITIIPYLNNVINSTDDIINNIGYLKRIFNNKNITLNDKYKIELILAKIMYQFEYLSLERTYVLLFQRINDIYLLRRIIDTKNVKNILMYYGETHVQFILAVLVKYFNAQILNCTNNDNNKFHSVNDVDFESYYDKISFRFDSLNNQCIEISEFPDMMK